MPKVNGQKPKAKGNSAIGQRPKARGQGPDAKGHGPCGYRLKYLQVVVYMLKHHQVVEGK
jgi:hypothetical protein